MPNKQGMTAKEKLARKERHAYIRMIRASFKNPYPVRTNRFSGQPCNTLPGIRPPPSPSSSDDSEEEDSRGICRRFKRAIAAKASARKKHRKHSTDSDEDDSPSRRDSKKGEEEEDSQGIRSSSLKRSNAGKASASNKRRKHGTDSDEDVSPSRRYSKKGGIHTLASRHSSSSESLSEADSLDEEEDDGPSNQRTSTSTTSKRSDHLPLSRKKSLAADLNKDSSTRGMSAETADQAKPVSSGRRQKQQAKVREGFSTRQAPSKAKPHNSSKGVGAKSGPSSSNIVGQTGMFHNLFKFTLSLPLLPDHTAAHNSHQVFELISIRAHSLLSCVQVHMLLLRLLCRQAFHLHRHRLLHHMCLSSLNLYHSGERAHKRVSSRWTDFASCNVSLMRKLKFATWPSNSTQM